VSLTLADLYSNVIYGNTSDRPCLGSLGAMTTNRNKHSFCCCAPQGSKASTALLTLGVTRIMKISPFGLLFKVWAFFFGGGAFSNHPNAKFSKAIFFNVHLNKQFQSMVCCFHGAKVVV